MRKAYIQARFNNTSRDLIAYCNKVIADYVRANLRITLRQLYYQLVSANVITNEEKSYKNLGNIVSKARLAGYMDWDAIEDRVRRAQRASEWESASDLMESALYAFRLPRLMQQYTYVELWAEKDAIASVLSPITNEYHVTLMVNRGYSSTSAMYESAQRIRRNVADYYATNTQILYLGDLDPSGEDMVRDIQDRLTTFDVDVTVTKVALNIDQVQTYNLPPNPAKLSDTRAQAFIAKYGYQSWEVDAIPPRELQRIVRTEISSRLDLERMEQIKQQEEKIKVALRAAVADLDT